MEYYAQSISGHFFTELSEFWDGGKLRKLQQDVEENIRSIAKTVSNWTSSSLPEGFNVIHEVQVDLVEDKTLTNVTYIVTKNAG